MMAFDVVVQEPADFGRWLAAQAEPAIVPTDPRGVRGAEVFVSSGCGACHAVRGTSADGVIGPDLTHVGSRRSLAAAALDDSASSLRRWIERPDDVKPGVHMPAFGMLEAGELDALVVYLESLR
jgi:cytochrome c oxidase subunit 2